MKAEKIILGIDPGTNVMGYGVLKVVDNKASLVVMGIIDMRKERDPYLRLGKIFDRVTGVIDEYLPDEMAIEAPFFGKNEAIHHRTRKGLQRTSGGDVEAHTEHQRWRHA